MELYDNTVESFHDFIDLSLSKGRAEDGLLKNSFKYAFDGENDERFIHLYLDYHNELITPDSERIKFYAQHYLDEVYRVTVEQSDQLLTGASNEQPEQTAEEDPLEKTSSEQEQDQATISSVNKVDQQSAEEDNENSEKEQQEEEDQGEEHRGDQDEERSAVIKSGQEGEKVEVTQNENGKQDENGEENNLEEIEKNEAILMGCALVSSVIMGVLAREQKSEQGTAEESQEKAIAEPNGVDDIEVSPPNPEEFTNEEKEEAANVEEKQEEEAELPNLEEARKNEEIEKDEATIMGCAVVSTVIMDVLAGPQQTEAKEEEASGQKEAQNSEEVGKDEEIEKNEATVMGCAVVSTVIMDVLAGSQQTEAKEEKIDQQHEVQNSEEGRKDEEIEKDEATVMGCAVVSTVIMDVLAGPQQTEVKEEKVDEQGEVQNKGEVYNLEEIEKNEAITMGCALVSSLIMEVLVGVPKTAPEENQADGEEAKEEQNKSNSLEEVEKNEAASTGHNQASSANVGVLARSHKLEAEEEKADKNEEKREEIEVPSSDEIEKNEATVMGCALVSSVIMGVLVGGQKSKQGSVEETQEKTVEESNVVEVQKKEENAENEQASEVEKSKERVVTNGDGADDIEVSPPNLVEDQENQVEKAEEKAPVNTNGMDDIEVSPPNAEEAEKKQDEEDENADTEQASLHEETVVKAEVLARQGTDRSEEQQDKPATQSEMKEPKSQRPETAGAGENEVEKSDVKGASIVLTGQSEKAIERADEQSGAENIEKGQSQQEVKEHQTEEKEAVRSQKEILNAVSHPEGEKKQESVEQAKSKNENVPTNGQSEEPQIAAATTTKEKEHKVERINTASKKTKESDTSQPKDDTKVSETVIPVESHESVNKTPEVIAAPIVVPEGKAEEKQGVKEAPEANAEEKQEQKRESVKEVPEVNMEHKEERSSVKTEQKDKAEQLNKSVSEKRQETEENYEEDDDHADDSHKVGTQSEKTVSEKRQSTEGKGIKAEQLNRPVSEKRQETEENYEEDNDQAEDNHLKEVQAEKSEKAISEQRQSTKEQEVKAEQLNKSASEKRQETEEDYPKDDEHADISHKDEEAQAEKLNKTGSEKRQMTEENYEEDHEQADASSRRKETQNEKLNKTASEKRQETEENYEEDEDQLNDSQEQESQDNKEVETSVKETKETTPKIVITTNDQELEDNPEKLKEETPRVVQQKVQDEEPRVIEQKAPIETPKVTEIKSETPKSQSRVDKEVPTSTKQQEVKSASQAEVKEERKPEEQNNTVQAQPQEKKEEEPLVKNERRNTLQVEKPEQKHGYAIVIHRNSTPRETLINSLVPPEDDPTESHDNSQSKASAESSLIEADDVAVTNETRDIPEKPVVNEVPVVQTKAEEKEADNSYRTDVDEDKSINQSIRSKQEPAKAESKTKLISRVQSKSELGKNDISQQIAKDQTMTVNDQDTEREKQYSEFEQDDVETSRSKESVPEKEAILEQESPSKVKTNRDNKPDSAKRSNVSKSQKTLETDRSQKSLKEIEAPVYADAGAAVPLSTRSTRSKKTPVNKIDIKASKDVQLKKEPSDSVKATPKKDTTGAMSDRQPRDTSDIKEIQPIETPRKNVKPLPDRVKMTNNQSPDLFKPTSIGDLREIRPKNSLKESLIISPKLSEPVQRGSFNAPADMESQKSPKLAAPTSLAELKPVKGSLANRLQQINDAGEPKNSPRRLTQTQEGFGLGNKESVQSPPKAKLNMLSSPKPQARHPDNIPRAKHQLISASDHKKKFVINSKTNKRSSSQHPLTEEDTLQNDARPQTMWKNHGRDHNHENVFSKTLSKFPSSYTDKFGTLSKLTQKEKMESINPVQVNHQRRPVKQQISKHDFSAHEPHRSNEQDLERFDLLMSTDIPSIIPRPKKGAAEKIFTAGKTDTANPYNTKWFRKVLKDHFDVDLEPSKNTDQNTGVKWKVRKIIHTRKSQKARGNPDEFAEDDLQSQEYSYPPSSNQGLRKSDNNYQRGGVTYVGRVEEKKQPAMNNFVQKSPNKDVNKLPSLHGSTKNIDGQQNGEQENGINYDGEPISLIQTLPLYHPDFLGNLQKHQYKTFGGDGGTSVNDFKVFNGN